LANLDYEVEKTSIHFNTNVKEGEDGIIYKESNDIEGHFATYRKDTNDFLGLVKSRYEIVQNKDAFAFFDSIVDSGEAIFETAGALGKGERIFVTAKLPEDMLVAGEPCNKYIILTNSHDGTSSIIAGFTTVRIVCNNTLQAALHGLENKVSIQHRSGAKERLTEAYKVMNIASKYMGEVEQVFNEFAKKTISDIELKKYITSVMQPNVKEKLGISVSWDSEDWNAELKKCDKISWMFDDELLYVSKNIPYFLSNIDKALLVGTFLQDFWFKDLKIDDHIRLLDEDYFESNHAQFVFSSLKHISKNLDYLDDDTIHQIIKEEKQFEEISIIFDLLQHDSHKWNHYLVQYIHSIKDTNDILEFKIN
jgi:phage/plasmid-like protein (TIGR03299 family)